MSAGDREPGIVPGSMGAETFIVWGRGCDAAAKLEREMDGIWFDEALTQRLIDEAPSAYRAW